MNRFILNYLGIFFILLSVLSFFNIIYSYYFNLYLNINTYFYTFLISLLIGGSSFLKKKSEIKITIYSVARALEQNHHLVENIFHNDHQTLCIER